MPPPSASTINANAGAHVQSPALIASMKKPQKHPRTPPTTELETEYVFVDGGCQLPLVRSSDSQDVSIEATEEWEKKLLEDPKNRLALHAFTSSNTDTLLTSRASIITTPHTYNVVIPFEGGPVTNQRASGRCWLFASTNVFRVALMKKYNLDSFELSQAYLFFWDKLEKANYLLENILDTLNEPLDGRLIQTLLSAPVNDGGQWDMVANLVKKYGLVPQALYPDSYHAQNSGHLGRLITTKLREYALKLRSMAASNSGHKALEEAKEAMLKEIHLILTLMLGPPPHPHSNFHWDYYDKDAKFHRMSKTPLEFASELSSSSSPAPSVGAPQTALTAGGYDVNKLFSLVHDPRNKYYSLLTVSRLGNIYNGRPVTYVNVPMGVLKTACVRMLQKGLPVFFGCDVGQFSDRSSGVMDTALFDYEVAFNVKLGMSKTQRLMAGESQMTHAMVLTGVQVEEEDNNDDKASTAEANTGSKQLKTARWRVQNSWAETVGEKGFFVMTDRWMDEFCYQAVVDPSVVSKEVREVLEQEPTVLDLWDPMGALA